MKITAIRDETVSIRSEISNAFISFSEMTVSAVAVITDVIRNGKPVCGFGFNSNGRYGQQGILRERMIPRLLQADPEQLLTEDETNIDPFRAWNIMMRNEKPGGHGERSVAVGTIDMALWDLAAKIEDKPLAHLLAERYNDGALDDEVYVYAAGGYYYPGKEIVGLTEEMKKYLDAGYNTVKMKIGGISLARDIERIESVLKLVKKGEALAVDANGRFSLDTALKYAEALNGYGLKWYEEPGDPLDFEVNKQVQEVSETPIATGENLFSMQDARNLIRYGGMDPKQDYLQFDPALSYGFVEYYRTLEMIKQYGWSPRRLIPHGGHQFALHLAAGLGLGGNESYPGVFEPFGGFADTIPVEDGRVRLSDAPGIGIEEKQSLMPVYEQMISSLIEN